MKKSNIFVFISAIFISISMIGCSNSQVALKENNNKSGIESNIEQSDSTDLDSKFISARVIGVTDGDTIKVDVNGEQQKVRLVGVDTPETKHPSKPVEYFGKEASDYTATTLSAKTVYLQKDVSSTDRYGRYLYYVWLSKPSSVEPSKEEVIEKMFNAQLVSNGYAKVYTYPPDVKYDSIFLELQQNARAQNLGLWGESGQSVDNIPNNSSAQGETPETASYIGNINSKKFHYSECNTIKNMSEGNKVSINSREEAINNGYTPCKACNP